MKRSQIVLLIGLTALSGCAAKKPVAPMRVVYCVDSNGLLFIYQEKLGCKFGQKMIEQVSL